jgi:hypothetical protein
MEPSLLFNQLKPAFGLSGEVPAPITRMAAPRFAVFEGGEARPPIFCRPADLEFCHPSYVGQPLGSS